jgi:hypothetical protein
MLAARDLNSALEAGWSDFEIADRIPLEEIVRAHEASEHPVRPGRIVVIPETRPPPSDDCGRVADRSDTI